MRQDVEPAGPGPVPAVPRPAKGRAVGALRTVATVLVLALSTTPARAQEAEVDSLRAVLAGQDEGRLLRVRDRSGRLFEGTYTGLAADSLRLRLVPPEADIALADTAETNRALALGQLLSIERRGRSTARGAWIAGLAGGLAGGFIGTVLHGICESACSTRTSAVLLVGGVGAGAGALLGAIVGAAIPRWHGIWP